MDYFVLNEHSFELEGDNAYVDICLITFFDVYKEAVKNDFREIRVSENFDQNWYEINLRDTLTIRNWIENQQEKDYKTRLKSLISSTTTPVFRVTDVEKESKHSFSEFKYYGRQVPVLGATFLLNQLSFSINSHQIWCSSTFSLDCLEINEEVISESKVDVNNVTTLEHWIEHFKIIKDYRLSLAKNKDERNVLIGRFEHIIFTPNSLKQIMNSDHEFFIEIWTNLQNIENVVRKVYEDKIELNYKLIIDNCPELNIADESDSVKANPKFSNARKFMYNDVRMFFGHHIRKFKGSKRLHFIIVGNNVVVGYAGKHLPTQRFPK